MKVLIIYFSNTGNTEKLANKVVEGVKKVDGISCVLKTKVFNMPSIRSPRQGSLQFWPRRRAKKELARVRFWARTKEAKPLGFIGYKAGIVHILAIDNRPKSLTKDEEISFPVTVVECPAMKVAGINFYQHDYKGLMLRSTILTKDLDKELGRKIDLPKEKTSFLFTSFFFAVLVARISPTNALFVFTIKLYISGICPIPNIPPPPVCCISFIRRINSGSVIVKGDASLSIASSCTV